MRAHVHFYIINSMRLLIKHTTDIHQQTDIRDSVAFFDALDDFANNIDQVIVRHIQALWSHPLIQSTFTNRSSYSFHTNIHYFMNKFDAVIDREYTPSDLDIVRMISSKYSGIFEKEYVIKSTKFKFVDVGGKKKDRKDWTNWYLSTLDSW
jgi:hypothetical protein